MENHNDIRIKLDLTDPRGHRLRAADMSGLVVYVWTQSQRFARVFFAEDIAKGDKADILHVPHEDLEGMPPGVVEYRYAYVPDSDGSSDATFTRSIVTDLYWAGCRSGEGNGIGYDALAGLKKSMETVSSQLGGIEEEIKSLGESDELLSEKIKGIGDNIGGINEEVEQVKEENRKIADTVNSINDGLDGLSVLNVYGKSLYEVDDIPEDILLKKHLLLDPVDFVHTYGAEKVYELDPDILAIISPADGYLTDNETKKIYADEKGIIRFSTNNIDKIATLYITSAEEVNYLNLEKCTDFHLTSYAEDQYIVKLLENIVNMEKMPTKGAMYAFGMAWDNRCPAVNGTEIKGVWNLSNFNRVYNIFRGGAGWDTGFGIFKELPKEFILNTPMTTFVWIGYNTFSPNYPNFDASYVKVSLNGINAYSQEAIDYIESHEELKNINTRCVIKNLGAETSTTYYALEVPGFYNWDYGDMIETLINQSTVFNKPGFDYYGIRLWHVTYDKLTDEDKAAIAAKGYILERITVPRF